MQEKCGLPALETSRRDDGSVKKETLWRMYDIK